MLWLCCQLILVDGLVCHLNHQQNEWQVLHIYGSDCSSVSFKNGRKCYYSMLEKSLHLREIKSLLYIFFSTAAFLYLHFYKLLCCYHGRKCRYFCLREVVLTMWVVIPKQKQKLLYLAFQLAGRTRKNQIFQVCCEESAY